MVFNATFNNISVISWPLVLLVDETGIAGDKHRPAIGSLFNRTNIKRSLHDISHIGPSIRTRLPYQDRQWSWRADIGRGLIPGTIWKMSCHSEAGGLILVESWYHGRYGKCHVIFIYHMFYTDFFQEFILYCKQDLWTDKLQK
jgi:hypothetical protein